MNAVIDFTEEFRDINPEYERAEWAEQEIKGRGRSRPPVRTQRTGRQRGRQGPPARYGRGRPTLRRPQARPRRRPAIRSGSSHTHLWREPLSNLDCTCPARDCPQHGSEYVRWVQTSLNQMMGLNLPVNGIMDASTRSALRRFQEQQGLSVDGIAGPETKNALIETKRGSTTSADTTTADSAAEQEILLETIWNEVTSHSQSTAGYPVLRRGSRGSAVRELQTRLQSHGFSPGTIDGIFGAMTEAAIKAFQRSRNLTTDGITGPQTWGALLGGEPGRSSSAPSTGRWVLPENIRVAGEAQHIIYDSPPAWGNGSNCSGTFRPGAADLRRYILANFRDITEIGGYACRQNTANLAETSVHGAGRALDIMIPLVNGRANSAVGDPVANWLIQNATGIGIQYIIWNRVSWNGSRRAPKQRAYSGPNPHIDHIHAELNREGAERRTAWFKS